MNIPKIPLGEWVDSFVAWLTVAFAGFFTFINKCNRWSIRYYSGRIKCRSSDRLNSHLGSFGYLYK